MKSISQLKTEAKAALSGKWGMAIAVVIINSLIIGALSSTAIGGLLNGCFAFGLFAAYLSLIRTKEMRLETLFSGFENFGTTLLAGILQAIFTFLWSLLFVIPGIVKSYSYAMTYYIMKDNPNLSANDAITESRKMMNGHKMDLFLLDLSFIGWMILTVLTFGLLSLYVVPYQHAAKAAFYESLKNQNEGTAEA